MRQLTPTTEADLVATFLRAELGGRFGPEVHAFLGIERTTLAAVLSADLDDPAENALRRRVLDGYRAYIFEEMPPDVAWYRAVLSPQEVMEIQYMDYSYWNELSGGSRLAWDAVQAIRSGIEIYEQPNDGLLRAEAALRAGARFPELILNGPSPDGPFTLLEGHVRLTAYALAPECVPDELEVVVGLSASFD